MDVLLRNIYLGYPMFRCLSFRLTALQVVTYFRYFCRVLQDFQKNFHCNFCLLVFDSSRRIEVPRKIETSFMRYYQNRLLTVEFYQTISGISTMATRLQQWLLNNGFDVVENECLSIRR